MSPEQLEKKRAYLESVRMAQAALADYELICVVENDRNELNVVDKQKQKLDRLLIN